jgi:membrane-bound lytic murein transglycosylase D
MRVARLQLQSVILASAILAIMALAASSCQTAQKPVALLPAGNAPALTAAKPLPLEPAAPQYSQAFPPEVKTPNQPPNQPQTEAPAAAPDNATPPSEPPAPDAVADLIANVEAHYQAGLADYQAGHADAAKQDFDSAFNAMLESQFDVRSDERLAKEFDRVVEGVNHLDLGDAPADAEAQKAEPAPIDETNGVTPASDPSIRAKAQAELRSTHSDLPLMLTDQVTGYISYFSNRGRGVFERAYARSGRYHAMMGSILREEGVPQDLIYLAQAESGFQPTAVSRAGARGIWQFMAGRGQGYGLHRSQWVDDRQDPEKSTRAAARHLKDLYGQFGDWYLAMAAYNSGPGTVQAAVKRTGYADFWELYRRNVLPKETRNYVPIILAMTIMTKNLSHYGFDDVSMDEPVAFDKVIVNYPVDLRLVADCVDATPAELQQLNPSLLRRITPQGATFELHLPAGTKEQYQTSIAAIPTAMRLWWRYPTVHSGETLASLARTYHTTPKSIAEANHLHGSELEADARLIIPLAPGEHPVSDTGTYARRITRYKVRRGDTVETVAENFGIPAQTIRRWNGLRGDGLQGRKVLALHLPVTPSSEVASAASNRPATHARKTAQTASAKIPARVSEGGDKSADVDSAAAADPAAPANVLHHKVKSGETLYSIATTYKTTVAALKRTNGNVATLHPGMVLIVEPPR